MKFDDIRLSSWEVEIVKIWPDDVLAYIIFDYSIACACAGRVLLLELRLREGMLILSRDSWHVAMQLAGTKWLWKH